MSDFSCRYSREYVIVVGIVWTNFAFGILVIAVVWDRPEVYCRD